jgi:multidrug efflux system membrane fusion protein
LGEGQGRPHAAAQRWKSVVGLAVLLLLVGGLGFTLGIMIRITKDGRETTVEVPPGSTARIGPDGQVNVELPGQAKSKDVGLIKSPLPAGAEAVAAQPLVPAAAELKALQPRAMIGTGVAQASGALSAGTYAPATPLEVPVIRPIRRQLTRHEDFTGRIEAAQTVDVRARATGNIEKIHFKGGMMVKKGDLLLEIDPRSDQAECDRAMANLAQAKAHFTRLEADFKRAAELLRQRAVSQEEYERAAGELAEAQAALQAAQAALNLANLALEHTRVFAPVAGRISDRLLGVGSLATANTTSLATIDSVDPICVAFDVDERTFLKLRRSPSRRDGEPGLPVLVQLTDEKDFPHKSKVESADTRIDPATGTACWRALLPNPDGLLMPGMFARVRLVTSDPHEALLVPERVLCSGQGQKLVFIVTDQNVVQRRDVIVGELEDDGMRVVEQGLAADDWVIEKGLQQVAPGMPVKPQKSPPAISPSSPKEK